MTLNAQPSEIQIHCPCCGQVMYGDRELARHLTKGHGVPSGMAAVVAQWAESAAILARKARRELKVGD